MSYDSHTHAPQAYARMCECLFVYFLVSLLAALTLRGHAFAMQAEGEALR